MYNPNHFSSPELGLKTTNINFKSGRLMPSYDSESEIGFAEYVVGDGSDSLSRSVIRQQSEWCEEPRDLWWRCHLWPDWEWSRDDSWVRWRVTKSPWARVRLTAAMLPQIRILFFFWSIIQVIWFCLIPYNLIPKQGMIQAIEVLHGEESKACFLVDMLSKCFPPGMLKL